MKMHQVIRRGLSLIVLAACLAGVTLTAHSVSYQGTVVAVEPAKVQVKTVDDKTKKEDSVWFVVNKDTKVKRGEATVKYAEASIAKGERIVVTIDHDAKVKMLATEIRLAAAK